MSGCHDTNIYNDYLNKCNKFKDDMEKTDKFIQCLAGLELKLMDRINEVLRNCVKEDSKLEKEIIELQLREKQLEEKLNNHELGLRNKFQAYAELSNKVGKLESYDISQQLDPKVWVFVNERLDKLEELAKERANLINYKSYLDLADKIEKLELCVKELERFQDITHQEYQNRPFKCPVCEGKGKDKDKLVAEPYDQAIKIFVNPDCSSCEGKGIIWR